MHDIDTSTLSGRVVIVTGGGSGLGKAICELLANDGARVVVADRNEAAARKVAESLPAELGLAVALDVGDETQAGQVLRQVVDKYGKLDAVINNAGVDVTAPISEISTADWDRVVRTNLTGPFLMSKLALPYLGKGSHIVNIASTAARRAWPNAAVYHATKWGLMGLSHALHAELRPQGIKVSAVLSGGMRTPFLLERFPDIDASNLQDPANVARAVRFVLTQPDETVIPEVMVLPMRETSWP
ncbi:SDR family oxidoreductase [Bordetella genomosp. 9]|uniref:Short-chain dehydrogenase n=1 Tax=Bordetella genomosp. 9 TaxID=1416803 RepID=A0A1W6YWT8_9BORD|nr:SDR family oxidoreductase [Bordetella genomosp. 9]ARP85526.1 short-chain dehydrogenase [Bordetella genomosp. 9]ARP89500.1 short-chain dehydrogenase [Bordetella genomosp. 9]